MLRGLPGSGKTRWAIQWLAEHPDWRRVNKDDLRFMLWGNSKPKNNESHLDKLQWDTIWSLLRFNFNVIVDNTHLSPKRERQLRGLVDEYNQKNEAKVEFEVMFFDTPLWQCILNDAGRPNPVGSKVIGRMYEQFLKPTPVRFNDALPDAYIVDLDGTLALHNGRSPYNYAELTSDLVNEPLARTIGMLADAENRIIFVSGRPEEWRKLTEEWLHNIPYSGFDIEAALHMRHTGDNRQDAIVKRELYDGHIKGKYNILGVFDDRNQVVEMWRALGLPVFHVNYGFF